MISNSIISGYLLWIQVTFLFTEQKTSLIKRCKKKHIINIVDDDYYIEDESHDYDDDDVVVGVVEGFRDYDDVVVVA